MEYVKVKAANNSEIVEVPAEPDGTLPVAMLATQFPGATGLKFENVESKAFRALRVYEGSIHPPHTGWGETIYTAVTPVGVSNGQSPAQIAVAPAWGAGAAGAAVSLQGTGARSAACERIFVGNLPFTVTPEMLTAHFPSVLEAGVDLPRHADTGKIKGFGYLTFESVETAAEAIASKDGSVLDGRTLKLDFAPRGGGAGYNRRNIAVGPGHHHEFSAMAANSAPCTRIYIGNIPFTLENDEQLKQVFPKAIEITMPRHADTNNLKGFAHAVFATEEDAKEAHESRQGYNLDDRYLKLDFAPYTVGGGGGGRGRGRGAAHRGGYGRGGFGRGGGGFGGGGGGGVYGGYGGYGGGGYGQGGGGYGYAGGPGGAGAGAGAGYGGGYVGWSPAVPAGHGGQSQHPLSPATAQAQAWGGSAHAAYPTAYGQPQQGWQQPQLPAQGGWGPQQPVAATDAVQQQQQMQQQQMQQMQQQQQHPQ